MHQHQTLLIEAGKNQTIQQCSVPDKMLNFINSQLTANVASKYFSLRKLGTVSRKTLKLLVCLIGVGWGGDNGQ